MCHPAIVLLLYCVVYCAMRPFFALSLLYTRLVDVSCHCIIAVLRP